MKKTTVLLMILFVVAAYPVFADSGVRLFGGVSFVDLTLPEALPAGIEKTYNMEFTGGLGFDMELSPNVLFGIDFVYAPVGTKITGDLGGGVTAEMFHKGYMIAAPVYLKIKFAPGSSPYIFGGGEVGYMLSYKVETNAGGQNQTEDVIDEINKLFYGAIFGAGIEIVMDAMDFIIEGRYRLGLSDLIKNPDPGDNPLKASAILALFGIRF